MKNRKAIPFERDSLVLERRSALLFFLCGMAMAVHGTTCAISSARGFALLLISDDSEDCQSDDRSEDNANKYGR